MIKILFVCHGNICRSPMAEFVMKDLVKKAGLSDEFYIASAATSTEEIGNGVHYGTRKKLAEFGISVTLPLFFSCSVFWLERLFHLRDSGQTRSFWQCANERYRKK